MTLFLLRSGIPGRIVFLLVATCAAVFSPVASVPSYASETTGIRGTVIWGPTMPGPTSPGQGDEAPLAASFVVRGADHKVARFTSDAEGRFEVALPAGDYTIVPDKSTPIPYAEKQTTQVTVPEDEFAVITIRLDTGMR